jgi:DNA-binding NarL/FixJ family response regulator
MKPRSNADDLGLARPTLEPLEQRVLEQIAQGLSNRQVAEQLGIPVELVRAQLLAIIEKLGASSKLEALIIALRHGFVRLPAR